MAHLLGQDIDIRIIHNGYHHISITMAVEERRSTYFKNSCPHRPQHLLPADLAPELLPKSLVTQVIGLALADSTFKDHTTIGELLDPPYRTCCGKKMCLISPYP